MRLTFFLALLTLLASSSLAQDWTRFRGPNGSGVSQGKHVSEPGDGDTVSSV